MNELTPFRFESHDLRAQIGTDGQPWFNANDLCESLGYVNPSQAISSHVDPDDLKKLEVIDSLGRTQRANHVNESGMYALILGSTKDEAKRFKRWVTSEVLPALRANGTYTSKPARVVSKTVSDLLRIERAVAKVPGVDPVMAMAFALDLIEKETGLPATGFRRALPTVKPEEQATLNATQVGAPVGMKARAVNALLSSYGLIQKDDNDEWRITEVGTEHGEAKPFHRNGHSGYEIRWKPSVIDMIRQRIAANEVAA